jgi:DNA-binding MarR family transcriptional regulator
MKFRDPHKRAKWLALIKEINPEIDVNAIQLMEQLVMVSRALYQIGEQSLDASGLSFAKFRVLMALLHSEELEEDRGGLNPSEISLRHGVTRNTVSALLRNLEEEGLIARTLDAQDRRKFNIQLTPAGRAVVQEHARQHFSLIANCFSALNAGEQESLAALLTSVGAQAELVLEGV